MAKKKKEPESQFIVSKYINPFTDFGFKKLFGSEPNKDLLIDFLNELLRVHKVQIKDITYKKTEHLGNTVLDRKVIFDLYCQNKEGEKFIVEMQKAEQKFFKDRTVFYSTFPIQEQAPKGDWNYELKAVFAVAILDFAFKDENKNDTVVSQVQLLDIDTKEVFYDKLTYVYIQMENFKKTIEELETHLDKWLYVLKHLDKMDRIPEKIKTKIFQKLFETAEYENLDKEERIAYEDSLKSYRDLKNSIDKAYEEGKKEIIDLLETTQAIAEQAIQREEQERKEKEQAIQREEQAIQREEQAIQREEQAIQREEQAIQREEQERKEKEQAIQREEDAKLQTEILKLFYKENLNEDEIAKKLNLSAEIVHRLL